MRRRQPPQPHARVRGEQRRDRDRPTVSRWRAHLLCGARPEASSSPTACSGGAWASASISPPRAAAALNPAPALRVRPGEAWRSGVAAAACAPLQVLRRSDNGGSQDRQRHRRAGRGCRRRLALVPCALVLGVSVIAGGGSAAFHLRRSRSGLGRPPPGVRPDEACRSGPATAAGAPFLRRSGEGSRARRWRRRGDGEREFQPEHIGTARSEGKRQEPAGLHAGIRAPKLVGGGAVGVIDRARRLGLLPGLPCTVLVRLSALGPGPCGRRVRR
ncbi:unnamed protein product [Urochloa humidicola]